MPKPAGCTRGMNSRLALFVYARVLPVGVPNSGRDLVITLVENVMRQHGAVETVELIFALSCFVRGGWSMRI